MTPLAMASGNGISSEAMQAILERAWRCGNGVQQLLKRERALVARVKLEDGGSVIAKLWCTPGIRALLKRKLQTSNCHQEYRALTVLHEAGASVPRPLARCTLLSGPYTEGMLMEDLGECVLGLSHVKKLLREGREAEHEGFIDQIFQLTGMMLRLGVIDPDHGLHNIVVRAEGKPVRIDFEVAKLSGGGNGHGKLYGDMMGRLLTSYIFAAQPDLARIESFARRIEQSLNPPAAVLKGAARYVAQQMEKQRATMNVDTQVKLDW